MGEWVLYSTTYTITEFIQKQIDAIIIIIWHCYAETLIGREKNLQPTEHVTRAANNSFPKKIVIASGNGFQALHSNVNGLHL